VSKLFPGSISDKELTRKSGLLDLLQNGDSMHHSKQALTDLTSLGINIPSFLKGRKQLDEGERIETRWITSLRASNEEFKKIS
jgi:hypothetical protein